MAVKAKEVVEPANSPEPGEKKAPAGQETLFQVEKLREHSIKLFGVSTSTFDGAMHRHEKSEYTVNEVKSIINDWLHGNKGGRK